MPLNFRKVQKIKFNLQLNENKIKLLICDNGKGFKKEIKQQKTLGIDIIKGLAEKLNAKISYMNGVNEGTIFELVCNFLGKQVIKSKALQN